MTSEQEYNELLERTVRIEERLASHITETHANFEATKALLAAQSKTVDDLLAALNRQKGFWGAVTMIVSSIAAALALFKEFILDHFTSGRQ